MAACQSKVEALGRTKDVEVIVADWGSDIPLGEALQLTPAASRIVSFMLIPPEIARPLQKDSPFPEVLALNAAARRARSTYIGRIDQDTLLGRRFLAVFFDIREHRRQIEIPLEIGIAIFEREDDPVSVRSPLPSTVSCGAFRRKIWQESKSRDQFTPTLLLV